MCPLKNEWYIETNGYIRNRYTKQYQHRVLMAAKEGQIVDHINRIRTDNRLSNLRIVDGTGNSLNRPPRKSKSGVPGVRKRNHRKLWLARIGINGKEIYLGDFKTKNEAIAARQKAEKEYWYVSSRNVQFFMRCTLGDIY